MTIVNKKCLDCGKDFEYDEKPGYPRKYCFSCSAERKKSFAEKGIIKSEEVVKSSKPQQNTTMYVSYAKDIFCTLKEKDIADVNDRTLEEVMKLSIQLVKQARKEFE